MEKEDLSPIELFGPEITRRIAHLFLTKTHETLSSYDLDLAKIKEFNEMIDNSFFTDTHWVSMDVTRGYSQGVYLINLDVTILLHDIHDYVKAGWQVANNVITLAKSRKGLLYGNLLTNINMVLGPNFDKRWNSYASKVSMDFGEPEFTPEQAILHTGFETVVGASVIFTYLLVITDEDKLGKIMQ